MKNSPEETNVYVNEYRLLGRAKEIANDHSLSIDELLKENSALVKAYEALLKRIYEVNVRVLKVLPGKNFL